MSTNGKPGRPHDPKSASSQAHEIYARMVDQAGVTPAQIKAAFVSELGVKEGTAQVYYHNCRKAKGLTASRPRKAKAEVAAPESVSSDASASASSDATETNSSDAASVDSSSDAVVAGESATDSVAEAA